MKSVLFHILLSVLVTPFLIGCTSGDRSSVQKLPFGYSVEAPCQLKRTPVSGVDMGFRGVCKQKESNETVIYKVLATRLDGSYQQMDEYDRQQVKNNLITYLKQKGVYRPLSVPVKNYLSYVVDSEEDGCLAREGVILTDRYVIDLVLMSESSVDEAFDTFIASLKPCK